MSDRKRVGLMILAVFLVVIAFVHLPFIFGAVDHYMEKQVRYWEARR